jgi:hypothetical protein
MHSKTMTPTLGPTCVPGALPGGLTRTRFFDGMFLTQADLENEQVFWRMKRRLTNRALGSGVVWGLCLDFNTTTRKYELSPGYALDCCGNDLIVECPLQVTESELWQRSDAGLRAPSFDTASRVIRACVVLQYVECPEGVRPVHRDACMPAGSSCEPSRVRETVRLLLVPECTEVACDPIILFRRRVDELRGRLAPTNNLRTSNATGGFTHDDPLTTLASLVIAGMQSYLTSAERDNAPVESKLMASYAMSMAMSALGMELTSLDSSSLGTLSTAAAELAAAFCDGCYPGPRCRDEHHGVYLGCVTLSPTGAVLSFDPHKCRRYVLTGPLLNWWLCQFGVKPIDTLFGQLFEKFCQPEPEPDPEQPPVILRVRDMTGTVDGQVTDTRAMSSFDLIATLLRAATAPKNAPGLVRVEATAPNGTPLRMVVPASAVGGGEPSRVDRLVETELTHDRAVQPLSRAPLRDLISELTRRTPASAVATNLDADATRALGAMTVADVLDGGPESMLARLGGAHPTDAHRTAANGLFMAVEGFVRDAAAASAPAGRSGVSRGQLENAELKAALKKLPGVTASAIDAAAVAAGNR